ncbi:MAG: GGDEF domain-containing protein [Halofilum sp. (in: g-proteobacteria)]|nr:GGDEF domain-containing protein [Halofilum sp. (in: g-proteobacteria)]
MQRARRLIERLAAERSADELIVALFSAFAVVFVVPFVVLRALAGEWTHAAIDALVALVALGNGVYAWRWRRADIAGALLALLFLGALVAVAHLFGGGLLIWAFPATAGTFFLLRPVPAAGLNALAIALTAPQTADLAAGTSVAGFFAALGATNVLALAFATAMANSRRRFRTLAVRDALTGTGNRRAMQAALADAMERFHELGTPASLIAFDLDHFKEVNDTRGHDAGDRALVALARLLRDNIRDNDDVFRYGGEEFVVLAHGARAGPAGRRAEFLRKHVARTPLIDDTRLTVSAGVAECRADETTDAWFRRADAMLYRAKAAGRDRVHVDAEDARDADASDPVGAA